MSSDLSGPAQKIWPWPDSLDALTAARGNHTVLFENDHVRVLQTRILPGRQLQCTLIAGRASSSSSLGAISSGATRSAT